MQENKQIEPLLEEDLPNFSKEDPKLEELIKQLTDYCEEANLAMACSVITGAENENNKSVILTETLAATAMRFESSEDEGKIGVFKPSHHLLFEMIIKGTLGNSIAKSREIFQRLMDDMEQSEVA